MNRGTTSLVQIDLLSDTATRPSAGMRAAMASAEVGDEQRGEDPTVNALCDRVAELLGTEAAVFLPSGTMCNQISIAVHCQPGDEVIMDALAHPIHFEAGGPSALGGVMIRCVEGLHGVFSADQVQSSIRMPDRHAPRSALVWIEQTVNLTGGHCWQLDEIRKVLDAARRFNLATHMDGARLFNAVVATNTSASEFSKGFDSVCIDLTKGLGAPVGAVLAGSTSFINDAWRLKQRWGGAMRQAGIIAAAGLYALEHNIQRLQQDHENAALFAQIVASNPHVELSVDSVDTNIVILDVTHTDFDALLCGRYLMDKHGIRIGTLGPRKIRVVTHLDITNEDVRLAAEAFLEFLSNIG